MSINVDKLGALMVGVGITFFISAIAAWGTHIIVAIQALVGTETVSVGYGVLLAVGAFMPPVGVIHGYGIWFGAW